MQKNTYYEEKVGDLMKKWIIGLLVIVVSIVGVLFACVMSGAKTTANGQANYMIILGAKVKASGEPSLALKERLDAAVPYLKKYPHVNVIVSGGKGADEPQSEAAVMANYLIAHGIEATRIVKEDESMSTTENLRYSKKLLPKNETAITLVSNDFHLYRAGYLAKKEGLTADRVAAKTPESVTVQLHIREMAAVAKTWVVGE